jgi:hypothetical protein
MIIFKTSFSTIFCLVAIWITVPNPSYSQERKDDELPQLMGTPKTLASFTGWTKNNIGKWSSLPNGIPQYDYTLKQTMPYCERLLKIDLQKIVIEQKSYWCLAKFTKHIYGYRNEKLEFVTYYWIFELPTMSHTTTDTSVNSVSFNTFMYSDIPLITYRTPVWADIIKDLKSKVNEKGELQSSIDGERRFFIQYRNDKKHNKVQFLIGEYSKNQFFETFDSGLLCAGADKNNELSNMYYEITALNFNNLFSALIK